MFFAGKAGRRNPGFICHAEERSISWVEMQRFFVPQNDKMSPHLNGNNNPPSLQLYHLAVNRDILIFATEKETERREPAVPFFFCKPL